MNNTQNNSTQKNQFIIQPKTKHKTDLVFMKSQNKQTQRSELRIPVLKISTFLNYRTPEIDWRVDFFWGRGRL
jgi:hypothetical protein